jgi:parvulin-like peptidyl-prolyl isomerase
MPWPLISRLRPVKKISEERTLIKKKSATLLSTVLLLSLLAGCSKSDQKAGQPAEKKDGTQTVASADAGKTADSQPAAPAASADAGKTTTDAAAPTTADTAKTDAAKTDAAKPDATADSGNQLPGQIHISLNDLPDDLVICTVAGSPIKVADYRRMMKIQQVQLQQTIASDPAVAQSLLATAKQSNITLTQDERTKLIATAKAGHGANFQNFLKEKNLTEASFDKQVENLGLQFKVANANLEQTLLLQLVQREIMAQAAQGQRKQAETSFAHLEKTPQFTALKSSTGLDTSALKDELVKGELAKMQIEKIARGIKVSDAEVRSAYNANKSKLQHGERVRLSSILLVAPPEDVGQIKSVRTQLKAANPKWTDKQLDTATTNFMSQQQNKALIIMGLAQAQGSDFARLANEKSEDPTVKARKNGGDMGWQEKGQLVPVFANAVWGLKPNTVLAQLVKTSEGFRIIKVTGHEAKGAYSVNDVRDVLVAKIKQEKLNRAVQQWVAQQQTHTRVEFSKKFLAIANDKNKTH